MQVELVAFLEERLQLPEQPLRQPSIIEAELVAAVVRIELLRLAALEAMAAGRELLAVEEPGLITGSHQAKEATAPTASRSSSLIANYYALHRPKQPRLDSLRRPHLYHLRRRTHRFW
jgi:hypothetical protein